MNSSAVGALVGSALGSYTLLHEEQDLGQAIRADPEAHRGGYRRFSTTLSSAILRCQRNSLRRIARSSGNFGFCILSHLNNSAVLRCPRCSRNSNCSFRWACCKSGMMHGQVQPPNGLVPGHVPRLPPNVIYDYRTDSSSSAAADEWAGTNANNVLSSLFATTEWDIRSYFPTSPTPGANVGNATTPSTEPSWCRWSGPPPHSRSTVSQIVLLSSPSSYFPAPRG